MTTTALPVEGWAETWASYRSQIVGTVVAFIRDHGPVSDDHVLLIIRRAGIGGDVGKASPTFDPADGARRILNLLEADVDAVTRTDDGLLYVAPAVTTVVSKIRGLIVVPSADAKALDAAKARHTEQLRRWMFQSPFATDWRDGIRKHTEEDVIAMAEMIKARGYCGPPIVCDQNGVIINGHLRSRALELLDIDVNLHTEVRLFINDLHRLAYVIAVHQQAGHFPTDLRKAIIAYVNRAAARSGEKVVWPDDIPVICGTELSMPLVVAADRDLSDPEPEPQRPTRNLTTRDKAIVARVQVAGSAGITSPVLDSTFGGHAQVSGALSRLVDEGHLLYLDLTSAERAARQDGCLGIYVAPEFRDGRSLRPRRGHAAKEVRDAIIGYLKSAYPRAVPTAELTMAVREIVGRRNSNISAALTNLKRAGMVSQPTRGTWRRAAL